MLPLLGRLGCNGRSCHGSFQGQGGFRLSLFGYDFKADHDALTAGAKPRVDVSHVADSLILNKPTSADGHGGGLRFPKESWQYQVLRRWIEGGARGVADSDPQFSRLEVEPREIDFSEVGQTNQLRVVAVWSSGKRVDVTAVTRFRSNDESVATISEQGKVTCRGRGDTHVVAFYDNGVAPIPVLLPMSDRVGTRFPAVAAATPLDRLVNEKLRKAGIIPSPQCTDAEFLRRASLDLTGTLPDSKEIEAFLADRSPDKRAQKIEALMKTPSYAAWWTTKLCDLTGNNIQQQGDNLFQRQCSQQWYQWIFRRVANNVPYDQIIAGLVLANSREKTGQSYSDYCLEMGSYFRNDHPADFAARATMPYYWSRRNVRKPEEKALSFTYAMLGVRLECAQCHKHPFDQWTQLDFRQFEAFFQPIDFGIAPASGPEAKKLRDEVGLNKPGGANRKGLQDELKERVDHNKPIPFQELYVARPNRNLQQQGQKSIAELQNLVRTVKDPQRQKQLAERIKQLQAQEQKKGSAGTVATISPKLLGAEEVRMTETPDPRVKLMEWLRRQDNPYFARAWVNRVWASYFGVGIVEPPDDNSLANPPSNKPLLDYLAEGFIANNYDMRWLHRTILNSSTYQRSWQTNETNRLDNRNFSHALIRRLPAEVVYDALAEATAKHGDAAAMRFKIEDRAIGPSTDKLDRYMLVAFGKPDRIVTCDCERSNDPTLVQTVFMLNDGALRGKIENGSWVRELRQIREKGVPLGQQQISDALIREVFLRTVSRPPKANELADARAAVRSSQGAVDGVRTLLWTMLNTKEFIVNH